MSSVNDNRLTETSGFTDEEPEVLSSRRGATCWIRFNRASKLNALRPSLMRELDSAIVAAEADEETRVLVLTGAGRAFSAGGDLNHFRGKLEDGRQEEVVSGIREASMTLSRLATCRKPVIAAVNGIALAGGLEIILCCDIVIAAERAPIGDAHLRYGVLPGAGGAVRLAKKLPGNVANWLLMTAETVSAEQMLEWGLVNEVVPRERLYERVGEVAAAIAGLSPMALQSVKSVVAAAVDSPIDVALDRELEAFARYVDSEDFREGVAAFHEGRVPRYEGR